MFNKYTCDLCAGTGEAAKATGNEFGAEPPFQRYQSRAGAPNDWIQRAMPFRTLPDLSLKEKAEDGWPRDWGLCIMGNSMAQSGIPEGTKCIKFTKINSDSIIEYFYPIPPTVNFLIEQASKNRL